MEQPACGCLIMFLTSCMPSSVILRTRAWGWVIIDRLTPTRPPGEESPVILEQRSRLVRPNISRPKKHEKTAVKSIVWKPRNYCTYQRSHNLPRQRYRTINVERWSTWRAMTFPSPLTTCWQKVWGPTQFLGSWTYRRPFDNGLRKWHRIPPFNNGSTTFWNRNIYIIFTRILRPAIMLPWEVFGERPHVSRPRIFPTNWMD